MWIPRVFATSQGDPGRRSCSRPRAACHGAPIRCWRCGAVRGRACCEPGALCCGRRDEVDRFSRGFMGISDRWPKHIRILGIFFRIFSGYLGVHLKDIWALDIWVISKAIRLSFSHAQTCRAAGCPGPTPAMLGSSRSSKISPKALGKKGQVCSVCWVTDHFHSFFVLGTF